MHLHMSFFLCNSAAQNENKSIMGTLLGNNSKEQKTDKGNRLYEFRRVQSEELQQYRIPSYGYLA